MAKIVQVFGRYQVESDDGKVVYAFMDGDKPTIFEGKFIHPWSPVRTDTCAPEQCKICGGTSYTNNNDTCKDMERRPW